ncbi:hypothetical protein [Halorussus litoreus]|uniref:hypothetical protein n=1 Tax=Halorussus litoreus TaxID=1710536 RepID=UPI000E238627|nr:hypothetical protein [Halorussus litoreus]
MGNVDTTKREVEGHEAKANPHSDSAAASDLYTDDDARAATDGQIDAETVDGLHATEITSSVNYVSTTEPSNPSEGEEWFDPDADAVYIWDGNAWLEETISDHRKLSSVQPGQHRSDSNIRNVIASGNAIPFPVYATEGDLPSGLSEGSVAYVSSTGELYVEDGT